MAVDRPEMFYIASQDWRSVPDLGSTTSIQDNASSGFSNSLVGVVEEEQEEDGGGSGTSGPRIMARSASEEALLRSHRGKKDLSEFARVRLDSSPQARRSRREEDRRPLIEAAWRPCDLDQARVDDKPDVEEGVCPSNNLWKTICDRVSLRAMPRRKVRMPRHCGDDAPIEAIAREVGDHLTSQCGLLEVASVHAALELRLCSPTQVVEHILNSLHWKIYKSRWPERAPTKTCISGVAQEILHIASLDTIQEILPSIPLAPAKFESALSQVFMLDIRPAVLKRLFQHLDVERVGLIDMRRLQVKEPSSPVLQGIPRYLARRRSQGMRSERSYDECSSPVSPARSRGHKEFDRDFLGTTELVEMNTKESQSCQDQGVSSTSPPSESPRKLLDGSSSCTTTSPSHGFSSVSGQSSSGGGASAGSAQDASNSTKVTPTSSPEAPEMAPPEAAPSANSAAPAPATRKLTRGRNSVSGPLPTTQPCPKHGQSAAAAAVGAPEAAPRTMQRRQRSTGSLLEPSCSSAMQSPDNMHRDMNGVPATDSSFLPATVYGGLQMVRPEDHLFWAARVDVPDRFEHRMGAALSASQTQLPPHPALMQSLESSSSIAIADAFPATPQVWHRRISPQTGPAMPPPTLACSTSPHNPMLEVLAWPAVTRAPVRSCVGTQIALPVACQVIPGRTAAHGGTIVAPPACAVGGHGSTSIAPPGYVVPVHGTAAMASPACPVSAHGATIVAPPAGSACPAPPACAERRASPRISVKCRPLYPSPLVSPSSAARLPSPEALNLPPSRKTATVQRTTAPMAANPAAVKRHVSTATCMPLPSRKRP